MAAFRDREYTAFVCEVLETSGSVMAELLNVTEATQQEEDRKAQELMDLTDNMRELTAKGQSQVGELTREQEDLRQQAARCDEEAQALQQQARQHLEAAQEAERDGRARVDAVKATRAHLQQETLLRAGGPQR